MKIFAFCLSFLLMLTAAAVDLPLRINAGGPSLGKPGSADHWVDGGAFVKGGANYKFGGGHDLSKVTEPGPDKIYETVRHQNHRYEINGLPEGRYQVRFHFTEGVKTNTRAMDYRINGELVINNLNILRTAGGMKKPIILDVPMTVAKGQKVVIEGNKDKGTDVFEAGLEIIPLSGNAPVQMVSRKAPVVAAPVAELKPAGNAELRKFAGGAARFVWLQGSKWGSYTNSKSRVALMGLDTEDSYGERKIIAEEGAFSKPIFTHDGRQIVFSDLRNRKVYVVDWNGENRRELGSGLASEVWQDPKSKVNWVYVRAGSGTKTPIVRRQLDNPKKEEKVWTRTENGHKGVPWFQLSADGRMFSDAFPWSKCGVGDLAKDSWKQYERGCWPGIAPDNSYRAFVFSGSHTDVNMFDAGGKGKRKIAVNTMPGIKGKKVYFPRWSNDPRFITVVGPESSAQSELYVGKFDSDYREVESWARVTNNSRTELYGDAWFGSAPAVPAKTPQVTMSLPISRKNPPFVEGKVGDWPGDDKGLVWIWDSAKAQNEAGDVVCGGDLHGKARFGRFHDLLLDDGWFSADSEAGQRIVDDVRSSKEFTIEAVITSYSEDQSGPARILSMSKNSASRNFTIGQEKGDLVLRVRTGPDDGNGTKGEVKLGKVFPAQVQHLLVTYGGGTLSAFVNGKQTFERSGLGIDFGSWDASMPVIFGDEAGGGRDWQGRLEGVAIFARAMGKPEAEYQNKLSVKNRGPRYGLGQGVTPALVSAKLLESTAPPTLEEMDSYRRALVENVYEVQKVVSGSVSGLEKDNLIIVQQWAVMDGKELEFAKSRKPGLITELTVEPVGDHPELEGEFLSSDHEHFGPPKLLDVNSHKR